MEYDRSVSYFEDVDDRSIGEKNEKVPLFGSVCAGVHRVNIGRAERREEGCCLGGFQR